jgi:hypothetical protein
LRLRWAGSSCCSSNMAHAGAGLLQRLLQCWIWRKRLADGGLKRREVALRHGELLLHLDGLCGALPGGQPHESRHAQAFNGRTLGR